jgi:hypothetical protein
VEGDVLGLAALDLILRRFRARMARVAVDLEIARMNALSTPRPTPFSVCVDRDVFDPSCDGEDGDAIFRGSY